MFLFFALNARWKQSEVSLEHLPFAQRFFCLRTQRVSLYVGITSGPAGPHRPSPSLGFALRSRPRGGRPAGPQRSTEALCQAHRVFGFHFSFPGLAHFLSHRSCPPAESREPHLGRVPSAPRARTQRRRIPVGPRSAKSAARREIAKVLSPLPSPAAFP